MATSYEAEGRKDRGGEAYMFCMGFISSSDRYRSQYIDRWEEVLANFMVLPAWDQFSTQRSPYRQGEVYRSGRQQIILKDPETHKLVMTYVAKIMRTLFGDSRREYVKAEPVGYEDAKQKAPTVTKLLRYDFGLPGMYRGFQENITEMMLVGTSIGESPWRYEERSMPVVSVMSDASGTRGTSERLTVPVYDDVDYRPVAVTDFYPDPSRYRIQDMCGAAKRFRMNAYEARAMGRTGIYKSEAVERAIGGRRENSTDADTSNYRRGIDLPENFEGPSEFQEMVGYEYWGEVPYDSGSQRMVVTILNGEVVREDQYPLADPALPFHSFIVNPVVGRFYGISPAEIVRYDQSFADAMKILMAEAVVRMVHPPIAFDPDGDPDIAALKAWKTDALVAVKGGPAGVGTIPYGANIAAGMNLMGLLKQNIQESSGAVPGVQGEPGPSREAATAAAFRVNAAMDQPELVARLLEEECLPPIGRAFLRRNQQFLALDPDPDGALRRRVGEQPEPIWIGDIMGDFDVTFSGSRQAMTRQQKLQATQTLTSMAAAIPQLAAAIPWDGEAIARLIGDILELPELASSMGDPATMALNVKLQQLMGGGAKGAPSPKSAEPPGLLPAQAAGAPLQ